jgi:hypothetical protein
MLDILAGQQKFTHLNGVPVLAIFALPHTVGSGASEESKLRDQTRTAAQAAAFERGVAAARVIRIPNADHYVFRSHEENVVREIGAFLDLLPSISQ